MEIRFIGELRSKSVKSTASPQTLLLVFFGLFSCCIAKEGVCPAEVCDCRDTVSEGNPQLLSNCSNASLHDLPRGLDTSTTVLDLSDNKITQLRNDTFDRTEKLVHLDRVFVNRNYIIGMESGTFRLLSSLSELHLESNLIASIPPGTFWSNPELIVLDLRNNSLSSLPVDIITLKNHVKELDISDNSIKKVDTYLVQTYYPELMRFDISRNRITRMFSTSPVDHSSLEVIDASFNYISELDPSAFSGASKLSELNVSNNEISNLSEDTFASNPELVKLDVSNNLIFTIHRDAFRNNPKITEIYAGSNSLTYLHPGTFRENPRLSKVTVSWNRIQEIHPQTFYNNPNLEYLDFNSNKLQTLNPDVFHNNPRLKSVDLRSNALVTIHETTFQNNPKLEHLFVSRNEHIRFHNGLIILASSLKVFDAEHCNLTHLSVDLFKNTTDLRELHLGNNNLTSLDCITDANSNDYVDTLTKLQVLDLANNQLQTISVEVLRNKMTDLKTLRIEGNPFLCDCKLRNVWLWSQKVGIIPSQPQITCTDVQQGTVPWDDVQHLNCSDESLTEESTSIVTFSRTEESSSTVTFIPTEDSTSKVRATHTEESTSAVTSTHTNLTTVSQQLKFGDKSLTEESVSAVTDVVTSMHNYLHSDRWRVHWPESSTIPQESVPEMEEPHKLSLRDEQYSFNILIGTLLFFLLAIVLVAVPLILLLRRSYRIYKVSKAKSKMENNTTA